MANKKKSINIDVSGLARCDNRISIIKKEMAKHLQGKVITPDIIKYDKNNEVKGTRLHKTDEIAALFRDKLVGGILEVLTTAVDKAVREIEKSRKN